MDSSPMDKILADHILKLIFMNSDSNFFELCYWRYHWQYPSIGLDNGLTLNRRKAIIWTNADPIH